MPGTFYTAPGTPPLATADLLPPYVAQRLVEQRDDLAALLESTTGTKDDE
jgi:hypothetical protein